MTDTMSRALLREKVAANTQSPFDLLAATLATYGLSPDLEELEAVIGTALDPEASTAFIRYELGKINPHVSCHFERGVLIVEANYHGWLYPWTQLKYHLGETFDQIDSIWIDQQGARFYIGENLVANYMPAALPYQGGERFAAARMIARHFTGFTTGLRGAVDFQATKVAGEWTIKVINPSTHPSGKST